MSAALYSLMRERPQIAPQRQQRGSLLAFIIIGGSGAVTFVVLSSVLIWLHTGLPNWLVNTLSYAALIGPVYFLHHRYSFSSTAAHGQALPRYVAVQGMALVLAAGFSFLSHDVLGMPPVLAAIVVVVLTAGVNFLVLRGWAFAHRRPLVTIAA